MDCQLGERSRSIQINSGSFDVTSVKLGTPVAGSSADQFVIRSSAGNTHTYAGNFSGTVTLNWTCVTWIEFDRNYGSGTSPDIDDVVYTTNTAPTTPTVTHSPTSNICGGDNVALNISGTLNDATQWVVYAGGCGSGSAVASTTGTSVTVNPTANTTYYVRGEGCGLTGSCGSTAVTVTPKDNPAYSYASSGYCVDGSDPAPTITGTTGGIFSASPSGLSINSSSGLIDVSASTPASYTIKYVTPGVCPDSSYDYVTISARDTASFSYAASTYLQAGADPTPTISATTGGTFSATPAGMSIISSTGTIDVSASTVNTYTVKYVTPGPCPDSSTTSITIINCTDPNVPSSFSVNPTSGCPGASRTISWIGSLNDATSWVIYTGSCGGTQIGSSTSNSFAVSPTTGTTYYVRGEGGCVTPGSCGQITVSVLATTTGSIAPDVCDSYTSPSGKTWTTSGTYSDTIPNGAGCDSVITVNLTIRNSTSSSISPDVCDSYTSPSGKTWTTSGTYSDTIPNAVSCDSVITVNLTVRYSTTATINPDVCDTYTSPSGKTWTTSGTYMDTIANTASCDSVITINLTVRYSTTATINPDVCDTYTSPSGKTWTTSGTYMDTIPNAALCDSVITINLTVRYSSSSSFSMTAYDSVVSPSGKVWTSSGVYMDTIPNAVSCDSVMTITAVVINIFKPTPSMTFADIIDSLNNTDNSAEVWVKSDTNTPAGPDRNTTFLLTNPNVHLLGGFDGTETDTSQRDPKNNPTVLSGNMGDPNDDSDNAFHVLTIVLDGVGGEEGIGMRIDGFTIRDGNSNGNTTSEQGGQDLYQNSGGGISIVTSGIGTEANMSITNCNFENNTARYGSAIYIHTPGGSSSALIENNTFMNNSSYYGAVYLDGSSSGNVSPTINACAFVNNTAATSGAAIYNNGAGGTASPTITNTVFSGNHANTSAGAVYNKASGGGTCSPNMTNNTFYNNSAGGQGGALYNFGLGGTCQPTIKNTLFNNNKVGGDPAHIHSEFYSFSASPAFSYSSMQHDTASYDAATLNALNGSNNKFQVAPGFTSTSDLDGADNTWRTSDDGLKLSSSNSLIDAGTSSGAPSKDILGTNRSSPPDVGAYEESAGGGGAL